MRGTMPSQPTFPTDQGVPDEYDLQGKEKCGCSQGRGIYRQRQFWLNSSLKNRNPSETMTKQRELGEGDTHSQKWKEEPTEMLR